MPATATQVVSISTAADKETAVNTAAPGQEVSPGLLPSQAMQEGEVRAPAQRQAVDWKNLVQRIHDGDPSGMEQLYGIFARGIRYFLLRNLGPEELDDKVHDCFLIVTQAIRNGELREPDRLMGYVRTVVKRVIAGSIDTAVHERRTRAEFDETLFSVADAQTDPEASLLGQQRGEIARRVFNGVSRRDREILQRFYVHEQSQEQICREMNLTYNQFRLLKSRAKARFGELGKRLALSMGMEIGPGRKVG